VRYDRPFTVIAVLCAVGFVSACSSSDEPPAPPCPRALIVNDAAVLTAFTAGTGRDFIDVNYQVEIADLKSGCQFETVDGQTRAVVAVAPVLVATRGPANTDRVAKFQYFVSVIGPGGAILNKELFDVVATFEGNQRRLLYTEDDPPITIDLAVDNAGRAGDYEMLVGLQLTPAQLDYNRRRRNVRP
jgi:hypothetical protein